MDSLLLKVEKMEPKKGNYKGDKDYEEGMRCWTADGRGARKIVQVWTRFFRDLCAKVEKRLAKVAMAIMGKFENARKIIMEFFMWIGGEALAMLNDVLEALAE